MKVTVNKTDSANATITASVSKKYLENKINVIAQQASKDMKIDGFRAGKVPLSVVKSRYADKLAQDAESDALQEVLRQAVSELGISNADIVGEPSIPKFDKKDGGFETEIAISLKPDYDFADFMDAVPEVKTKKVTAKEIDTRVNELAKAQAVYVDTKEDRGLENGDQAIFDFEGFVDGVAFDGGKAEKFSLVIGSGQFISGFEEKMIGIKAGEETTINVKFPDDYQAQELKGKESEFKIKLHSIQIKDEIELNEETIKAMMPGVEDASLDKLKEQAKEQIKTEKMADYYNKELKPVLIESLIEKFDFDLPNGVVEAEVDNAVNTKVKDMSEDEIKELKEDSKKVDALREDAREDARKSVKLTFIIDAIANIENIKVSDEEVEQVLRYEAMMYGQDADSTLAQYKEQGLLPMVKMSMVEDRLITHLLDKKLKGQ
jgi:trigger factor